jgi:hypothetical protein
MMDDVVGLVMVQVISNLGGDGFSWVTVVRPILVSIAFAVITPLACLFIVKPVTIRLNQHRQANPATKLNKLLHRTQTAFAIHTLLLISLVAGATYAGTSNLFAAYIAGATISWWDSEVPHPVIRLRDSGPTGNRLGKATTRAHRGASTEQPTAGVPTDAVTIAPNLATESQDVLAVGEVRAVRYSIPDTLQKTGGSIIYRQYYHEAVSKILQPLFFASIGFSIPITRMFSGTIIWRGLVYTLLMSFGKMVCGFWLVRLSASPKAVNRIASSFMKKLKLPTIPHLWRNSKPGTTPPQAGAPRVATTSSGSNPLNASGDCSSPNPPKPFSLHPPLILAFAMCARGEIGFLISGVAESKGVFSVTGIASNTPSDIFLVVTWGIVLCTIVGPLGVGLSVRRVKKLQNRKNKQQEGAGRDVLGVWGVD